MIGKEYYYEAPPEAGASLCFDPICVSKTVIFATSLKHIKSNGKKRQLSEQQELNMSCMAKRLVARL